MQWYDVVVGGNAIGKEPTAMSRITPTAQENAEQRMRWRPAKKGHKRSVVATAGASADNWAAIYDGMAWQQDNWRANMEEEDDLEY